MNGPDCSVEEEARVLLEGEGREGEALNLPLVPSCVRKDLSVISKIISLYIYQLNKIINA